MRKLTDPIYRFALRSITSVLRLLFPSATIETRDAGEQKWHLARQKELQLARQKEFQLACAYPMNSFYYRALLANIYLRGEGIEVGALCSPLQVPATARVKYVDRMSIPDLLAHYPQYSHLKISPVDIIDDGERLRTIPDASQDFVICNSTMEHYENPLRAMENMLRVLKVGGILYMAIPDKRFIFDRHRPVTPFSHVLADYPQEQPPRRQHFEEWVRYLCTSYTTDEARAARTEELMRKNYSIHYHCWTQMEIMEMIIALQRNLGLAFKVRMMYCGSDEELVVILEKVDAATSSRASDSKLRILRVPEGL